MSSLDRAFIRAYAKDQPPAPIQETAAEQSTSAESPTHYQPLRQPQLRYRIEPSHAPWGQSALRKPHVDMAPAAVPDEETYPLASSESEAFTPSAWSAAPRIELPAYTIEPEATSEPEAVCQTEAPALPVVLPAPKSEPVVNKAMLGSIPPVPPEPVVEPTATKPAAPVAYDLGEIVCLPGMEVPESNYLATLLATSEATEPAPVPAPMAVAAEPARVEPAIVHDEPETHAAAPEAVSQPEPIDVESLIEKVAEEVAVVSVGPVAREAIAESPQPVVESSVVATSDEPPQAPLDDASAFWEVDQFLYPAITDRLVREYSYFAQAGDKLKQAAAAGLKVLAITGLGREEGRSTLAVCLARSAANAGLKVGLIDCDFERPTLAHDLGLDVATGWQNVAVGKMALPEVAIRSVHDQITLLPLTQDAATSSLQLGDARVANVIADAAAALDVVVLDIGPLNPAVVAARKSVPFDAAIVVWDHRSKKLEEAQAAALLLSNAGVEAVGVAENFAREAKHAA
jgi:Mrp family chromosome partitioning ATPase